MHDLLRQVILKALLDAGINTDRPVTLEQPADPKFGDFSTNIALLCAKSCGKKPRELGESLLPHLVFPPDTVSRCEIAGAGFINFYLSDRYIMRSAATIIREGEQFGQSTCCSGKKAIVEYVSANPTGPLTIGRGRGGVLGDCLANLLLTQSYSVTREYYFNDAGRQIQILGESVQLRYRELCGESIEFPPSHYQGDYIREIAAAIQAEHGASLNNPEADARHFRQYAQQSIFASIRATLERLGIHHDSFFNEHTLYQASDSAPSSNQQVIDALERAGYIGKYDGAVWFLTTKLGQEKDKVLVKSTGEPSYRLPDIAYHITKFDRGFDVMVNVFGADHIDEYPDVVAALSLLGYDASRIQVAINQFVTTTVDGQTVKMSTRKGNADLLDELIDTVGADATRLFFITRGKDSHLNFDIDLARKASKENPVFYLQYAHARICSLLRIAAEEYGYNGETSEDAEEQNQLLNHPAERQLAFTLLLFGETIRHSLRLLEPQKIVEYLHDVAEHYHRFYQECPILKTESSIRNARLGLSLATRQVLRNGFRIIGISAPESM